MNAGELSSRRMGKLIPDATASGILRCFQPHPLRGHLYYRKLGKISLFEKDQRAPGLVYSALLHPRTL